MSRAVCRAAAITLTGLEGTAVMVEAAVSQQLPGMAIIGLPDASLAEAKLRVRSATAQLGMPVSERFVTVNLSPASLPKQGSGFDLAIALAALAALGHLPAAELPQVAHLGELGLDGELRRPAGLLPAAVAARALGFRRVMVPEACSAEAALVPDLEVIAMPDLAAAVSWYRGDRAAERITAGHGGERGRACVRDHQRGSPGFDDPTLDIADVVGQPEAVEALTVAAAGRHHLSLLGPPGAGKTLLASRLPTILPDLTADESLTASSIAALGGVSLTALVRRPPMESPHHTASKVAVIGGGDSGGVRPGAITRACHGVLFLDEAPNGKYTYGQCSSQIIHLDPDSDLIPLNAPPCPHCDSPVMIPWADWWECPRCDGKRLPDAAHQVPDSGKLSCSSLFSYEAPRTERTLVMFGLFRRTSRGNSTPVYECGYAYPHHSEQPHYHVGHPRKKTQSMAKGTGPFDGDTRYANTGVPPNPPGTTNPPLARGQ